MKGIECEAEECPEAQDRGLVGSRGRVRFVESKDSDQSQVEAVQDACTSGQIVEFLRAVEVSCMEYHREGPARQAKVSEQEVVLPQRVGWRNGFAKLAHAPVVSEEVEQREEDGEGLLHAHEAVKGPLPVELDDGLGRIAREAGVGDNVLASVVAFSWAIPEQETSAKGLIETWSATRSSFELRNIGSRTDGGPIGKAIRLFTRLWPS